MTSVPSPTTEPGVPSLGVTGWIGVALGVLFGFAVALWLI